VPECYSLSPAIGDRHVDVLRAIDSASGRRMPDSSNDNGLGGFPPLRIINAR
jgi:hypothetical protein